MADTNVTGEAPVIIIRKKKGGHGGHHGGAWKVAYADFVTAMMAFFLVMWIVGLSKPSVKQAIQAYFKDPVGFEKMRAGGKSPFSDMQRTEELSKPAALFPSKSPPGIGAMKLELKMVEEAILKQMQKTPEFRSLKDNIDVHLTDEGLRIELIEKTSSLFFASGSANLQPRTVRLLQAIAKELSRLDNPIVIEGHTDSRPLFGANGYSNWELSADRANAARRAMETNGLRKGQVTGIRGYADRKLKNPGDPFHFSNRRVSILVAYTGKPGADKIEKE